MSYQVILYYNFSDVDNPEEFCLTHKKKCKHLKLLGRVYVACEGINGTLAGTKEKIQQYKEYVWSLKGFEKTEFKDDFSPEMPFVKLMVKTRPEIVSLKSNEVLNVKKDGGVHLSPEEWRKVLDTQKDYILLDVRNDYESKIGHFKDAICPDVKNFYDFPQWIDEANLNKNKKVLMYCTGGIRCEKFSAFMKTKGFKKVYQLQGGIINYAQKIGDAHYKGKCFVFDDRLAMPVEKNQKKPLAQCEITGVPCDQYLNCANPDCNRLFICSQEGAKEYQGCCSKECLHSKRRRPFNPENIYSPTRKWYHYFAEKI